MKAGVLAQIAKEVARAGDPDKAMALGTAEKLEPTTYADAVVRALAEAGRYEEALELDERTSKNSDSRRDVYRRWLDEGEIGVEMLERLRAERFRHEPLLAIAASRLVNGSEASAAIAALAEAEEALVRQRISTNYRDDTRAVAALATRGRCWSAVAILDALYERNDEVAAGYSDVFDACR